MINLHIKKTTARILTALSIALLPAGPVLAAEAPAGGSETGIVSESAVVPGNGQVTNNAAAVQGAGTKKAASKKKVPSIRLGSDKVTLNKDKSRKLSLSLKNTSKKNIVWSSNRNRIATVSKDGKVTARKKGTAVITARVKGTNVKATCKVEVQNYKVMRMRTTGYCNCRRCAGKWAGHATASGRMPKARHTIAVDRRLIPLGTKVQIGDTVYTAEDTGGAIKGRRIDVYYSSHRQASRHGVKYELVKVFY